jgi:hypothetical protein
VARTLVSCAGTVLVLKVLVSKLYKSNHLTIQHSKRYSASKSQGSTASMKKHLTGRKGHRLEKDSEEERSVRFEKLLIVVSCVTILVSVLIF